MNFLQVSAMKMDYELVFRMIITMVVRLLGSRVRLLGFSSKPYC